MTADNNIADVNGNSMEMAQPVRFVNGHIMVPLRFVSTAFGANMHWDAARSVAGIASTDASRRTGTNVIFFHPDGFGLSHWDAVRTLVSGPNGRINWDRLPHMAVYSGNMADSLTGTSHGGATVHAYGIKVLRDSLGLNGHEDITALSGKNMSIMEEAVAAGYATALIQTGGLTEAGTAAFVASVKERDMHQEIAAQIIESGVDVILSGGEGWLLPEGTTGRYGPGRRTDGLNLITRAKALGYTVVYTRSELMALGAGVTRVLGVFAHGDTFNTMTEEALRDRNLPAYAVGAPTIAEMSEVALRILSQNPKSSSVGKFIVAEEEGTDNFPNFTNAGASFEAGRRADEAFGVFADFVEENPNTLLLTAADSNASGKLVIERGGATAGVVNINTGADGRFVTAPLDGVGGAGTANFIAAPDQAGNSLPFSISWTSHHDHAGGILVRAKGLNAERVSDMDLVDNTDIYRILYYTLFDRWLP